MSTASPAAVRAIRIGSSRRPAPNAGGEYSVYGHSFVPNGSVATTPPANYNAQPYITMTREDDRYNAAFMAHQQITPAFQPYAELFFMDDKTQQAVAPAALFKDSNPLDPTGAGDYYINCSNPLLSAQERGILCTPAQIAADYREARIGNRASEDRPPQCRGRRPLHQL